MKNRLNHIFNKHSILPAILVVTAFIYFTLNSLTKINNHLNWDELNYETLSRKGIVYNALEKNSLNFIDFYRLGKARADKDTILNAKLVKEFGYPEENVNPFYLRHYHPPLANYYWSLFINKENIAKNDRNLRISNIILGFLAIITLFIVFYFLKKWGRHVLLIIFLLANLLLFSNIFNYAFERINFHTFQFLFSIVFMTSLMNWINLPAKKRAIVVGLCLGLMFLVLETAAFIFLGAFIALFVIKKAKQFLRHLIIFIVSTLSTLIIFWPGILKTLAPVKTWVMYAARLFLKGNDEYAGVSILDAWKLLFIENIFLFTVIISLTVLFLILSNKQNLNKSYLVPYIVAFFYLIFITPFILNKTYVFPVIGLFIFAIIYNSSMIKWSRLQKIRFEVKYMAVCIVLVALAIFSFWQIDFRKQAAINKENRIAFNKDIDRLNSLLNDKKEIIAFNGQLLRYYLKRDDIKDLRKNKMQNPGFYVRENGMYKSIINDIVLNNIEAIIFHKDNYELYNNERTAILENNNYKKIELNQFRVFIPKGN